MAQASNEGTRANLLQAAIARACRLYPFISGTGTLANSTLFRRFSGTGRNAVWARVDGGEVLASLDEYVGRSAYFFGDLDPKISQLCRLLLRPGDRALDVGANIGIVTLLMSRLVGSTGQVHSFEPNPVVSSRLMAAVAHSGVGNVTVYPKALGDQPGKLILNVPPDNAGAASLVHGYAEPGTVRVEVPVVRLDDEISQGPIRLMKIDVEGFELMVLRGARNLLAEMPPDCIVFEHQDRSGGSASEVLACLSAAGYRFYAVAKSLLKLRLLAFDPTDGGRPLTNDVLAVHRRLAPNFGWLPKR
ncbi:FkbM family methyltransferase [Aquabacterium sp. J223]|uniref:FkbM family methyltransferase n=1 Tax=Aquabacterium sp. J223 TaxID=2898431 RepID=UPI0021ADFAD4|nr:FkbM family methyltransferase [Aquabacterium sp. J223]UUX95154.1 FkbM family methyltransferase [Aquabacterium sp. J223]